MKRMVVCLAVVQTVSGCLLGRPALLGQQAASGAEFQVNTYTTGTQGLAAAASDQGGALVVVWMSYGSSSGDTDFSVQAQRYDAAGAPLGLQFQVNAYTTGNQVNPAVGIDPGGNFVVVWGNVQAQRYDASGAPLGAEFQVNTYTTGHQGSPAVAVHPDGDFVVVWESNGSSGTDSSSPSIQAQRYNAAGVGLGEQFQINSYTPSFQDSPAVAVSPGGGFVAVWRSDGSSGNDVMSMSVQAKRYDAAGASLGVEFQVNTYTTGDQRYPAVATGRDGGFVVVWESDGSNGGDTSGTSVQAQRYNAAGAPIGAEFQVNSYTSGDQRRPKVASDNEGDFVVVWQSYGSGSSDISGPSIQARRYTDIGVPLGVQFQVNTFTTSFQSSPAVSVEPDGDFVVVWSSFGSSGTDNWGYSVQGQRFRVTGDVGDLVFFDLDFDGLQDADEPGLSGIQVHLFENFANRLASTRTDSDGLYRFKPKAGSYYLQFELPSSLSFTPQDRGFDDALDSDAEVFTGRTDTFDVLLAGDHSNWDAGMASGIGDRVWLDVNGNGRQDGGEPGLAGISIELVAAEPAPPITTTTDSAGHYSFPALPAGLYYLKFTAPSASTFTLRNVGSNHRADSDADPVTGVTDVFTFANGDLDVSWDAGIVTAVTVGDRVWLDDDGNGIQDGGELGVSGVEVRLRHASGGALADTAITDAAGFYGFTTAPGGYYLEVVRPPSFAFSPRDLGGDDQADSDANPTTGTSIAFTLGAGGPDLSRDAGLEPAVLGNLVWLDRNANGLQDSGEPGVSGISVRLRDAGGALLHSTTSDASGRYAFAGFPSNSYVVEFAPAQGSVFTARQQGSDPKRDSDADPTTGRSGLVAYTAGTAARSIDAGLLEIPIFGNGFESGDLGAWSGKVP